MFENVEFTDRYGSAGPPSWLRGCHGDCEATGWIPAEPEWYSCPACRGTGRVSWWVTLARVPRWLGRGVPQVRELSRAGISPPDWSLAKRVRTAIWCCYGADLQSLFR